MDTSPDYVFQGKGVQKTENNDLHAHHKPHIRYKLRRRYRAIKASHKKCLKIPKTGSFPAKTELVTFALSGARTKGGTCSPGGSSGSSRGSNN